MYENYSELRALPPEAYLVPENFATLCDSFPAPGHAAQQYAHGLEVANNYAQVGISRNGTWFASDHGATGRLLTSYEGIGYHSNTAALLAGLLAGKAEFIVHREDSESVIIKPAQQP